MKTKHLFFTMALAGVFAACTNDDFLENGAPQSTVTGQERPTISDVTLKINEANTRVTMGNNGFQFEEGDKISALLMDENNTGVRYGITTNTDEWNKLTWLEKYHLVDYVHTNFPFVYDGESFKADCNMLEGNYFLTYPYVCLDGNRQGRIDIAQQEQVGDESADRARTIAKNQYFIGYAQLKAGEGVSDFQAQLVPILAPVRFSIQSTTNVGTTLHVTKVVISNPKLTGTLMIDPTRAYYNDPTTSSKSAGWNLETDYVKDYTDSWATENSGDIYHFNYANYLANQPGTGNDEWKEELYFHNRYGSLQDMDYVYNVKGEVGTMDVIRMDRKPNTYYWDDAIRAAVQPMHEFNNPEYATQYVEVTVKDTENSDCMVLAPNSAIEVVMMLPAFQGNEEPLLMSIYTKEGIIKDIDLSKQLTGSGTDVQTSGKLDRIDPTDKEIQRLVIKVDNPAVVQYPTNVTINNENDLKQWVEWLNTDPQNTGDKNPIATFTNDITIDDDLAAAIEELDDNYILSIISHAAPGNNLRIATTAAHANILEHLDVASNVTVEVMDGAVLNMTSDSYNVKHEVTSVIGYPEAGWGQLHIEVAEGGLLNIVSNDKYAIEGGYDNSGNPVANRTEVLIENKGTIDVQDTELIGFYIVNEGTMNVIGEDASIYFAPNGDNQSVNTIKGTINVREGGKISGTSYNNFENRGTINNGSEILNIINLANDNGLKPGLINIENVNAKTDLSKNTGTVNYGANLTGVSFNNTMGNGYSNVGATGTYIYNGGGSVLVSALHNAYVTDATVTNGTLTTDMSSVTTLKNLVIDGSKVIPSTTNRTLQFAATEGTIVFKNACEVQGISFGNLSSDIEKNVVVDSKANVTFTTNDLTGGTAVAFWESVSTTLGGLYFETAQATVESGCTVWADKLASIGGTKSNVYNYGAITLTDADNVDPNVTVNSNKPVGKE